MQGMMVVVELYLIRFVVVFFLSVCFFLFLFFFFCFFFFFCLFFIEK